MVSEPRTVKLPVCDECGLVGKRAWSEGAEKNWCYGPRGNTHKRNRMQIRTFVEEQEPDNA